MATGDVQGNLGRLRAQVRSIGYPHPMDLQGLKLGLPSAILPLLHHALLGYSRHLAKYLSSNGYELYAKSDLRFVECVLRFLRSEFGYRCSLTVAQIFSRGFSERKMLFVHDVVQCCKRKHNELLKLSRPPPAKKLRSSGGISKPTRLIKIKRTTDAKNEQECIFKVSDGRPPKPPQQPPKAVDRADTSSCAHMHSPRTLIECPSSGLQVHLSTKEDSDLRSPGVRSPESRHGVRRTFSRALLYSDRPEASRSPEKSPNVDASLPRNQEESSAHHSADSSLPRKLDSISKSPKKPVSPLKHDRTSSPVRPCHIHSPPKLDRASPTQLDAVLTRNAEVMSLCYDDLKQKMDDLTHRLESRFGSIERSFTKSSRNIEAKFNALSCRVDLLEKTISVQGPHISDTWRKHAAKPENCHQFTKCYDDARMSSPIKDISNVHQNYNCSPRTAGGMACSPKAAQLRGGMTVQEFVASIMARCDRTKELLSETRRCV